MTTNLPIRYQVLNLWKVRAITSSTNATPIVVTAASHWFSTWDRVRINWHATNTAANGTWTVTRVDANSFSLDDSVWNWVWAWTWVYANSPKDIFCRDYKNVVVTIATDWWGDAAMTLKLAWYTAAIWGSLPDVAKAQSATNMYDFIQMIDYEDNNPTDWDTWFIVATADDYRQYMANVETLDYITVLHTAWTAGEVSVWFTLYP